MRVDAAALEPSRPEDPHAVLTGFDIRSECRRIEAPVLAIQGEDDPYGTPRQIAEIEPTRGAFSRQMLPQCGHSPQRDQSERTRRKVAEFLAALP